MKMLEFDWFRFFISPVSSTHWRRTHWRRAICLVEKIKISMRMPRTYSAHKFCSLRRKKWSWNLPFINKQHYRNYKNLKIFLRKTILNSHIFKHQNHIRRTLDTVKEAIGKAKTYDKNLPERVILNNREISDDNNSKFQ